MRKKIFFRGGYMAGNCPYPLPFGLENRAQTVHRIQTIAEYCKGFPERPPPSQTSISANKIRDFQLRKPL